MRNGKSTDPPLTDINPFDIQNVDVNGLSGILKYFCNRLFEIIQVSE
jgi:hypothetical protein